ncbi:MAG: hypothetical protein R3E95_02775 [Thiolinea sp.]
MTCRNIHANALHQAGQAALALELFQATEALQQERQPGYPRLYSLSSFRCDLLLSAGETTVVLERAEQALEWGLQNKPHYWVLHWINSPSDARISVPFPLARSAGGPR